MDSKLLALGRALAARYHRPALWLFTDARRLPDPCPAAARLPRGIAGIVFRHDEHSDREALALRLAPICRDRRIVMVVAGDVRLAARCHAGVHLRGGRWPVPLRRSGFLTSSAHHPGDLHRAAVAGVDLVFLSPAFKTASHPDAAGLGAVRWAGLARQARVPVAALGGIDGTTARRLPPQVCRGFGAIGALA